jgi:hypothetical protein
MCIVHNQLQLLLPGIQGRMNRTAPKRKEKTYLCQPSDGRKQRSIGQEAGTVEKLHNARTQLLQSVGMWILGTVNDPCQTQRSTHLPCHANMDCWVTSVWDPFQRLQKNKCIFLEHSFQ